MNCSRRSALPWNRWRSRSPQVATTPHRSPTPRVCRRLMTPRSWGVCRRPRPAGAGGSPRLRRGPGPDALPRRRRSPVSGRGARHHPGADRSRRGVWSGCRNATRWALMAAGERLRLYRKGGVGGAPVSRSQLPGAVATATGTTNGPRSGSSSATRPSCPTRLRASACSTACWTRANATPRALPTTCARMSSARWRR